MLPVDIRHTVVIIGIIRGLLFSSCGEGASLNETMKVIMLFAVLGLCVCAPLSRDVRANPLELTVLVAVVNELDPRIPIEEFVKRMPIKKVYFNYFETPPWSTR